MKNGVVEAEDEERSPLTENENEDEPTTDDDSQTGSIRAHIKMVCAVIYFIIFLGGQCLIAMALSFYPMLYLPEVRDWLIGIAVLFGSASFAIILHPPIGGPFCVLSLLSIAYGVYVTFAAVTLILVLGAEGRSAFHGVHLLWKVRLGLALGGIVSPLVTLPIILRCMNVGQKEIRKAFTLRGTVLRRMSLWLFDDADSGMYVCC